MTDARTAVAPAVPAAPIWAKQDLVLLARLPVGLALAWFLPEHRWDQIAAGVARWRLRRRAAWAAEEIAHIRKYLGDRLSPLPIETVLERQVANLRLRTLQVLRGHRPGGWRPRLEVVGVGHLEAALAQGRGAILWPAPFAFDSLLTKMALHRAGYAVHHLSRYTHPFTASRLGARLINPVQTSVEDRYLAERVRIERGQSARTALARLTALLGENRVVSISVGSQAENAIPVAFLGASIALAAGPLKLMRRTGAPLLPVFTVRDAPGSFRATIEAPLAPPADSSAAAMAAALHAYAAQLEAHTLRWPDQFLWRYDVTRV